MPNRIFRILSALLIVVFLLSACASNQAVEKPPLRVSWSLWPGYYPIAIAQEKGFFEKHGVKVEPVFYNIYTNQLPDLASGMIDGAVLTLSDTMFDSISGTVNVVMVMDNSAGADQIVASAEAGGVQDLRGKRIGVSRSTVSGMLLINQLLQNNGISLSDVTIKEVSPENVPGALGKTIDLGYTYDPFTTQALSTGGKILFTSADAPGLIVDVLAMRTDIVKSRPEDVRAFVAAWLEAVEYWKSNPAEGNAIIAKATGLKPEEVSSTGVNIFDLAANQKTFVPGTTSSSVFFTAQNELKFLVESGDITRPVDTNKLLDSTFVK